MYNSIHDMTWPHYDPGNSVQYWEGVRGIGTPILGHGREVPW